jgi:uncharacterized protein DUF3558
MSPRRSAIVVAVLLLLAGCGTKTAGTPVANFGPLISTTPSRPRGIDLAARQRCLLAPTDWAGFFIEKEGKLEERTDDPKGVECAYNTNVGYFGFLFSTTNGVEYWTSARVAEKIDSVAPVLGYPAFERAHGKDSGRCDIIVDVSEGQALDAFASIDDRSASKLPPKCETARKLAEIAITALSR